MLRAQDVLNRLGATRSPAKHPVEKLQILVDYIAENAEGNANDEANINEVIFAAKKNIAETILHSQSEHGQKHTIHLNKEKTKDDTNETENKRDRLGDRTEPRVRIRIGGGTFCHARDRHGVCDR